MMKTCEITLDTSEFESKLNRIDKVLMPEALRKGMGRAVMQLLNDAAMEIPTVPLLIGTLRGSGSAFVDNKYIGSSANPTGLGTPSTVACEVLRPDEVLGMAAFNTPYAARLHEHPEFKFTEPGSGGKYLEASLAFNSQVYMHIIADALKEAMV